MKISDLEGKEKGKMEDLLESKSTELGMDTYEGHETGGDYKLLKDLIGIGYNCKSLNYCKTEFLNVFAKCGHYEMRLRGQNRIIESEFLFLRKIFSQFGQKFTTEFALALYIMT